MSLLVLLVAMACVFVAAGCGSGGSSSISQAEFIKKGDAICAEGRKEIESDLSAYLKKNKVKEFGEKGESEAEAKQHEVTFIETVALPGLSKQVEELKSLGTPEGAEAEAEDFFKAVEGEIKNGEKNPGPLLTTPEEVFEKSDTIAQEIGFKVCGNRSA